MAVEGYIALLYPFYFTVWVPLVRMIELWMGHFDPQTDLIIPGDLASTYVENKIQTNFGPNFKFSLYL